LFPSLSSLLVSSFFRNHSTRLQTLEKEPSSLSLLLGRSSKYRRQVRSKSSKTNKIAEGKKKFTYTNNQKHTYIPPNNHTNNNNNNNKKLKKKHKTRENGELRERSFESTVEDSQTQEASG
jgi:hypothetical protein